MAHRSRDTVEHNERARSVMKAAGYTPESAVHKHERGMHPDQKPTKFARGGTVKGPKSVTININTGGDKNALPPPRPAMPMPPPPQAAGPMPPRPVPPAMGPPPMGPQIAPRPIPAGAGPMNTGGTVKVRGYTRRKAGGRV